MVLLIASRRHHTPPTHQNVPHYHRPPPAAAAGAPLLPGRPPQAPAQWIVGTSQGLAPKMPGMLPGMGKKGVQLGSGALTPTQGRLNGLIDRPVSQGRSFTGGQPASVKPSVKVRPEPPPKPLSIPEPP
ncbi:MAG: hypothetical protein MUC62_05725, partial [Candidatus Thermoplasmatota archaeon]|nr:hypothetical protein [Candidatus Thermoplasmatota archaeon]